MTYFRIITLLICFWGFCLPAGAETPALLENMRIPHELNFCGESPDHSRDVQERFEKEMLLILGNQPQVILWLKRSTRYLPFIAAQLKSNQMPEDLKYLAVAESALQPHVGSSKGAVGYWQMLAQTARRHGLLVNKFVDERREINASTQAAIKYLKNLYQIFGSWTLAVAAYNMGEDGLRAEILEQNTRDYYKLYLPLETQRFIFRIMAIKLILEEPGKFGFHITPDDQYAPVGYERISLDCTHEIPIRLVADAANSYFKAIKDLNPHLRGHYLQEGNHRLYLPSGAANGFEKRFKELVKQYEAHREQRIYIVQRGDSLSSIAAMFEVPLGALLIWNKLDLNRHIHPGDRLVIHPGTLPRIDPE